MKVNPCWLVYYPETIGADGKAQMDVDVYENEQDAIKWAAKNGGQVYGPCELELVEDKP